MRIKKVYYRGKEVKYIFNLIDTNLVDLALKDGKRSIKSAKKSELMIPLVDAEEQIAELEKAIKDMAELMKPFIETDY